MSNEIRHPFAARVAPPPPPPPVVAAPAAPEPTAAPAAAPAAAEPTAGTHLIGDAANVADTPLPFPAADAPRSESIDGLDEAYNTFVTDHPELRPQADAVIAQINDPMLIKQEGYDTCAATVVQRGLAGSKPLNYFNTATQLMVGGDTSKLDPPLALSDDNRAYAMRDQNTAGKPDPVRNVNQTMQAALMEFGNGTDNYDLAFCVSRGEGDIYSEGLTETEAKGLFETVLGQPPLLRSDIDPTNGNPAALQVLITSELTQKGELYLPLDFGESVEVGQQPRGNYSGYDDGQQEMDPIYATIESNMSHMVKIEGAPYAVTPTDPHGKPYMTGTPPVPYSY
ncbi:MAG: hypothetical protein JWM80_5941, partial [Cyanobacteria bacterium RYN_339]|nr:hypothetical protein [Cyanobacteria bacterium RYN_339]